ncbi:MAG TPA: hypothetical protein VFN76_05620 [Candidatus Limnocylindria bacterium]|nr:hypothetical protein [Candidatus Limnocylindria bacterium]
MERPPTADGPLITPPRQLLWLAAAWALWYAAYRAYYALGGTFGMFGTPVSFADWRLVNGLGAALIVGAAGLPIATVGLWKRPRGRLALLAFGWTAFVGCVMHALVSGVMRVLSLAGAVTIDYPFWAEIDTRAADLQDLFFNEPWFLIEGLLWAAMCLVALGPGPARQRWLLSAIAAIGVLTAIGLLSGTGVIGRFVIG